MTPKLFRGHTPCTKFRELLEFSMTEQPTISIKITLPQRWVLFLLGSMLLHVLLLLFHLGSKPQEIELNNLPSLFKIKEFKTLGKTDSKLKNQFWLTPEQAAKSLSRPHQIPQQKPIRNTEKTTESLNFHKLAAPLPSVDRTLKHSESTNLRFQDNLKDHPRFAQYAQQSPLLSKTQLNVLVEPPEGVDESQLNKSELKYYAFHKRMMERYISALIVQARKYENKYPIRMLMPEGIHTMTGRATFDQDGNIKQMKMIRWTEADKLQAMFEDVMKMMDTIPNPPKDFIEKSGDFTVFYSLIINSQL
jgi:hypothetical protein